MKNFTYVYILEGIDDSTRHYVGITGDLETRLKKHNSGSVPHTTKYRPWKIRTAIAFDSEERAVAFERYLKSHSGRAFSQKRL